MASGKNSNFVRSLCQFWPIQILWMAHVNNHRHRGEGTMVSALFDSLHFMPSKMLPATTILRFFLDGLLIRFGQMRGKNVGWPSSHQSLLAIHSISIFGTPLTKNGTQKGSLLVSRVLAVALFGSRNLKKTFWGIPFPARQYGWFP